MRSISIQAQLPYLDSCHDIAKSIYALDGDAVIGIREGRGKVGPWLIIARFFLKNDANYDGAMKQLRERIDLLGGTGKVKAR